MTVEQLWQPVPGGSGTYVKELARALLTRSDTDLVGVTARHAAQPIGDWAPPTGLRVVASRLPRPLLYETWTRLRGPRLPLGDSPRRVVHATTWAVPPVRPPHALVVTVHDLAFLRDPGHFTRRGNGFFRRALAVVREEADAIIAVSSTTRDDCLAAGLAPERVHVVPNGVAVPPTPPERVAELRQRLGLRRPYVLWCGTLEPRKNVPGLLRAFAHVVQDHDVDLVLAGPTGWGAATDVVAALRELPEDRVHRVGPLAHADLHAAYAGAAAFCFPSFWEGFGLPVLEAMAHGVPVVTSAGTSTAEIGAGGGAVLVDPRDAGSIAEGLHRALSSDESAAAVARRHAATYSWARCAEETTAVYRSVMQ